MRTARGEARDILESFMAKVRQRLNPRGRFVILSHAPSATLEWGSASRLSCQRRIPVRLGGMGCEFQVFTRD